MSAIIGAVRELLTAHAPLTAVVPASRIVAGELPQDAAFPAIVMLHSDTTREGNMAIGSGEEYLRSTIEVLPLAAGYAQMDSLVQLVEAAVHGKRGVFAGVSVHSCLRWSIGADEFFDERGLWSRPISVQCVYTRP